MDTRENNNTTHIKESYFLSDAKLVGGIIFYIDGTVGGEYQFFDADGNVIENIGVGDRPYAYKVIRKGSKDKYYVYHDEVYNNLRWTYCRDEDYTYESLGTSWDIGSGKTNTETAMTKDNGVYTTANSNELSTIWYRLQQVRNAKVGGCNDWFVPSTAEVMMLREAIKSGIIMGGMIAGSSYGDSVFNSKWLWSSSENSDQYAWAWGYNYQLWFSDYKSNADSSVFFARAF